MYEPNFPHPVYPHADLISADLRHAMRCAHNRALRETRITPRDPARRRILLAERELAALRQEIERIIILLDGRR